MGLRYEVGIDYPVYMDIYNNPYSIHALFIEPIWNMIIKVMRSLGFQSRAFFFLTSLITFLGFYYGIKKMSPHFYMSLFLLLICGFYFESANLIRQYVAISLLFAGFHFFLDGNIWKYMIWIAIAACFHTSVLFIAPLILLNRLKYPTFILLIILGISHIFGDKILSILINNIMPFLQDINSYQYAIDDFDSGANSGLLRIFYYIIVCSIIILYTKFRKDRKIMRFVINQEMTMISTVKQLGSVYLLDNKIYAKAFNRDDVVMVNNLLAEYPSKEIAQQAFGLFLNWTWYEKKSNAFLFPEWDEDTQALKSHNMLPIA